MLSLALSSDSIYVTATDPKHYLIPGHEVTNDGSDRNQVSAMAHKTRTAMGSETLVVLANAGYFNAKIVWRVLFIDPWKRVSNVYRSLTVVKYVITPEFKEIIGQSRLDSLNNHPGTVYGIDSEYRITYLNPAWFQYSKKNGGASFSEENWSLGRNILDCTPKVLEPFYKHLFESAFNDEGSALSPTSIEYECSSPAVYRNFSMHFYPVSSVGLLIVHSVNVEAPLNLKSDFKELNLEEDQYIDDNGIVHQCANCRRIKNLQNEDRWDWIPKWVEAPALNTSHGICNPCAVHYYGLYEES